MKEGTTAPAAPDSQVKDNVTGTGAKNQKINSSTAGKIDRRRFNKGVKGKAGRKPKTETLEKRGLADELNAHLWETVEVIITNRRTGETLSQQRTRLRAMLDTLAEKGIKDKDVAAIREYFDRTTGKPAQAIKHSGEVGTYTAKRPSAAALTAKRAYERASYGK